MGIIISFFLVSTRFTPLCSLPWVKVRQVSFWEHVARCLLCSCHFAATYGMGMNGILYAQPIADVISVVITVFMALHLIGNCLWLKNRLCPIRIYNVLPLDFYY